MYEEKNSGQTASAPAMKKITCDQEAWLRDRLVRLVVLVTDIQQSNTLDKEMIELATEGAINGQALAILQVLNLEPEYTNLPKRSWWFSDTRRKNPNGLFGLSNPYSPLLSAKEFMQHHNIKTKGGEDEGEDD